MWIKEAVTKGTLSVKINDIVAPYFASFKGVRQGVLLLPFCLTWLLIVYPK
jgi:hypothetical protein